MCYEFNIYRMRTEIEVGQKFGKWTVIDSTPVYTTGGQRNVKVQYKLTGVNTYYQCLNYMNLLKRS